MLKLIPAILSACLLGGIFLESLGHPKVEDAQPFHAAAKQLINAIPTEFDDYESREIPIPQAAQALLRPNAQFSREYVNKADGRRASFLLVQCADSRDMAGHYPPVCYPANGWEARADGEEGGEPVTFDLGDGVQVPAMRYEFSRIAMGERRKITVYNFFAIPAKGYAINMKAVRRAAATFGIRFFGAAQFQVVVEGDVDRESQESIVRDLWSPIAELVEFLGQDPSRMADAGQSRKAVNP